MKVAKFQKRPVVIDAVQVDSGDYDGLCSILGWIIDGGGEAEAIETDGVILISTLEGAMSATDGDWIIRGVQGEHYPCKPDIFAATYDRVPA